MRSTKSASKLRGLHIKLKKKVLSILRLTKKQSLGSPSDLETKKIMKRAAQILQFKGSTKLSNQERQKLRTIASHDNVININQEVHNQLPLSKKKQ